MSKKKLHNSEKVGTKKLTVVGIGASAGGVPALEAFFAHMPTDSGLAFVVVIHLAAEQKSFLAEILQPHVKLPVRQVNQTTLIEPDHIYVIPSGSNLNAVDGHLHLSSLKKQRSRRSPINHFFRTLAATYQENSVGIILTGAGSDGTLGIKEIKRRGGLTIVQNPKEAEYDSMPRSAISTGVIDQVLPLVEIPEYLLRSVPSQTRVAEPKEEASDAPTLEKRQFLAEIIARTEAYSEQDFSIYKRSAVLSGLQHRMEFHRLDKLEDYRELLQRNHGEIEAIREELLETTTIFFGNTDAYQRLAQEVIPAFFNAKKPDQRIRVWVVGCGTGEEVYSLGMLLLEESGRCKKPPKLQIFASELHVPSLNVAREGFYSDAIEALVSEERLKQFFSKVKGGYRIRRELRDLVVFARQDVVNDPPFSNMDLVVCRRMLLNLRAKIQSDLINLFHYAIRSEGYLWTDDSGQIRQSDQFEAVYEGSGLYLRQSKPTAEIHLPVFSSVKNRRVRLSQPQKNKKLTSWDEKLHQQILLQNTPPSMLVSPDNYVLHLSGQVEPFVELTTGDFNTQVLMIVRKELRAELRAAISIARQRKEIINSPTIHLQLEHETQEVSFSVFPARNKEQDGFLVIVFQKKNEQSDRNLPPTTEDSVSESIIYRELETELTLTHQQLQETKEGYETMQEEMTAFNEEMQSTNEERRYAMQELERRKDEVQSLNDELASLNQKDQEKVEELSKLSDDLQNFMAATEIATLFLDSQLRVMRYSAKMVDLFTLVPGDREQPLTNIPSRLNYPTIQLDAQRVLDKSVSLEREVQDIAGRWYIARLFPYRVSSQQVKGVVINFIDITARRRVEEQLREREQRYRSLFNSIDQGFCIMKVIYDQDDRPLDYQFTEVNPAFEAQTGLADVQGRWIREIDPNVEDYWIEIYGRIALTGKAEHFVEEAKFLGNQWYEVYAFPIGRPEEHKVSLLFNNITERKRIEDALRKSEEHLRLVMESATDYAIFTIDLQRTIIDWNTGAERILGYSRSEAVGKPEDLIFLHDDPKQEPVETKLAQDEGRALQERRYIRKDGSRFWGIGTVMPLREGDKVQGYLKIITDNSERRLMVETLRQAKSQAELAVTAKEEFLAMMSHEIRTPLTAIVGLSSLLMEQNTQPTQAEVLQTLKVSSEHLKVLVDDILDLSKLQAGEVVIEKTEICLRELLDRLQKIHRYRADEQQVDLQLEVDDRLPEMVRTDSLKLMQVLNNLLGNAIKFTKKGVVSLTVSLEESQRAVSPSQIEVTFSVQDSGIGIPAQQMPRIFDSFQQADMSTVREYGGTGLGLTISKLLLELMGAQINVESQEGKGSRFYFTLLMPVGSPEKTEVLPSPTLASDDTQLRSLKVLLAEDITANQILIQKYLQLWWGTRVDTAVNGKQAVEMASQKQYDFILMDIRMPIMDGYQATRAIRTLPEERYQEVPILALTASSLQEVKQHPEAIFFTDVVTKPYEPSELRQKIIRWSTAPRKPVASGGTSEGKKVRSASPEKGSAKVSLDNLSPNIAKLQSAFMGNRSMIDPFLEEALKDFTEHREKIPQAVIDRDSSLLATYAHELTSLLSALNLDEIKAYLEHCCTLIDQQASKAELEEACRKMQVALTEITSFLRRELQS